MLGEPHLAYVASMTSPERDLAFRRPARMVRTERIIHAPHGDLTTTFLFRLRRDGTIAEEVVIEGGHERRVVPERTGMIERVPLGGASYDVDGVIVGDEGDLDHARITYAEGRPARIELYGDRDDLRAVITIESMVTAEGERVITRLEGHDVLSDRMISRDARGRVASVTEDDRIERHRYTDNADGDWIVDAMTVEQNGAEVMRAQWLRMIEYW